MSSVVVNLGAQILFLCLFCIGIVQEIQYQQCLSFWCYTKLLPTMSTKVPWNLFFELKLIKRFFVQTWHIVIGQEGNSHLLTAP